MQVRAKLSCFPFQPDGCVTRSIEIRSLMRAISESCEMQQLLAITVKAIQKRDDYWVIADLLGKGGHVRTVPYRTLLGL